jgi:hypothetical protein
MHKPITFTQIALSSGLSIAPAFIVSMCPGLGVVGVALSGPVIMLSLLAAVLVARD